MKARLFVVTGLVALVAACATADGVTHRRAQSCMPSGTMVTCNYDAECCSGRCTYEGGYCR